MAKQSVRRTHEIGTTLLGSERELLERALEATGTKLATYVRDAVLAAARRDVGGQAEPAPLARIDLDALTDAVIERLAVRVARRDG